MSLTTHKLQHGQTGAKISTEMNTMNLGQSSTEQSHFHWANFLWNTVSQVSIEYYLQRTFIPQSAPLLPSSSQTFMVFLRFTLYTDRDPAQTGNLLMCSSFLLIETSSSVWNDFDCQCRYAKLSTMPGSNFNTRTLITGFYCKNYHLDKLAPTSQQLLLTNHCS